jgi:hypothetical protein
MISGVVLEAQESIRVFALDWLGETVVMDVLYGSPGGISLGSAFGKSSPSTNRRSTDCGSSKKTGLPFDRQTHIWRWRGAPFEDQDQFRLS